MMTEAENTPRGVLPAASLQMGTLEHLGASIVLGVIPRYHRFSYYSDEKAIMFALI